MTCEFSKIRLEYKMDRIHDERSIDIYLTNRCQLTCPYCFVKNEKVDMTDETKEKVIDFCVTQIKADSKARWKITLTGGEVGLLNPKDVLTFVQKLKAKLADFDVQYGLVTNLCYLLTGLHFALFSELTFIGLSYDGSIRLNNPRKRKLWFDNVRLLRTLNYDCSLLFILTKDVIANDPRFILDFCLGLNIYNIEFWALYGDSKYKPTNKDSNEWLYQLFLEYERLRADVPVKITTFECQRSAFYGQGYYEYGRHCMKDYMDIQVDGTVGGCSIAHKTVYGHIDSGVDRAQKILWIAKEHEVDYRCIKCKHYDYCLGHCFKLKWDDTDCPTPHKIFDYLKMKNEFSSIPIYSTEHIDLSSIDTAKPD